MDIADVAPRRPDLTDGLVNRSVCGAPADNEQRSGLVAELERLLGDVVAYPGQLVLPHVRHPLMIRGVVRDVAGLEVFLEAADTMHQAGHPGRDPGPRQRVRIAIEGDGMRIGITLGRYLRQPDRRQLANIRYSPWFCSIGQVPVTEKDDRRHVPQRDSHGLDRSVEAIPSGTRGDDRHRRVGVPPINCLVEIRLFRLGWQTGRRTAPLPVDDNERQFGADRQAHSLGFQCYARARTGCHAYRTPVRCTDRRADRRNLVFGLECSDPEFSQSREPVQQRAGGSDRVRAEQQRSIGQFCRRRESECQCLSASDASIYAWFELRALDLHARDRFADLGGFRERMAGSQGGDIGVTERVAVSELFEDPRLDRRFVEPEHPHQEPERPEVLATPPVAR